MERLMDEIYKSGKNYIILGDMNIDYLVASPEKKKVTDILCTHDLINLVDFPTRVTDTTSTSLDHVYVCSEFAGEVCALPVSTQLSDHFAVRIQLPCDLRALNNNRTCLSRCFTQASQCNFIVAIDSIDWDEVGRKHANAAENLAKAVTNIIKNKIDIYFPLKQSVTSSKKQSWVTDEMINLHTLLRDMKNIHSSFSNNEALSNKILEFQNKYDLCLKTERSRHYTSLIRSSSNVTKTMWNVVNMETGRSKRCLDYLELLKKPDGSKFQTKEDAVDAINAHFVNAAKTCGAPSADVAAALAALVAARPHADRSFRLKRFTPDEVYKIVKNGVAYKTTKDIYDISVSILHAAAAPLANILSHLYNTCLGQGVYPNTLKNVKVSPLYKGKGKQEDLNNYKPVSIIPVIAKILENGLSTRLASFLQDTQCLSESQYAYRAGRSTTDVARGIVRRVLEARERNQQVAVIFCDLSKAFDVADHVVLTEKLRYYGIDGPALSVLVDFMTSRSQVVVGKGGQVKSRPLETTIGVAQGSSISNIVFSILLNDLPDSIHDGHILMYADDVAAVVSASSVDHLERKLNTVAKELHKWFTINGLILNVGKTHFMHFNLAGRSIRQMSVALSCGPVESVTTTAFLGFIIDKSLTWEGHIDTLCSKLGRACFALWRLSATLPSDMVRSCYFASVQSIVQYGVEFWGRASSECRNERCELWYEYLRILQRDRTSDP